MRLQEQNDTNWQFRQMKFKRVSQTRIYRQILENWFSLFLLPLVTVKISQKSEYIKRQEISCL
ncbi:hypothetical protein CV014_16560 [Nostoc sp. CMAA1605]|nr:hypothetical protein [Nostoc sp. CMAA1605]